MGADIDPKGDYGLNVLHCAIWNGQFEVMKTPVERGAHTDAKDNQGIDCLAHCHMEWAP